MNVQPGYTFEAVLDSGLVGLVGTVGFELNDNLGSVIKPFTTGGIIELAPGVYSTPVTAPTVAGQYSLIWRNGAGGSVLGVEDLIVSALAISPLGPPPVGPGLGMSGADLITEFLADRRFGQNRERVLGFLNYRYGELLQLEEWAFLEGRATLTLDQSIVPFPPGVGIPWRMWLTDDGAPLAFLELADFEDQAVGDTMPGRPRSFAVYGPTLLISPAPDAAYGAMLLYQLQAPLLADDDVPPITPPETHLGLVAGAQAFALELENDGTGGPLEARFDRTIDGMRRRYLTSGRGTTTQMPRDPAFR